MKKEKTQECPWPRSSQHLCWWCCHPFQNVPAFLPVSVTLDHQKGIGKCVFSGNFCSWNCAKRYALVLESQNKLPAGCYYLGLFAFLTVSKGDPCEGGQEHELGLCDCVEMYRGVKTVPSREMLQSFGGTMSIEEYRRGFHVIYDYQKVQRLFGDMEMVSQIKKEALKSKNVKFWGFHYLHYKGPDVSYTTHVNILPLTNRTFNKKNLVRTGNESFAAAQKLGGSDNDDDLPASSTKPRRGSQQPRARRISRRGSAENRQHAAPLPPTTTTSSTSSSNLPRIMTQEQSLACNDEQTFYTNSLRGFGNILDSMGIQVTRPLP